MLPSYSLRIPKKDSQTSKRRKRKSVIVPTPMTSSHKYTCYQCGGDVYFLPGHELICPKCASRIVLKIDYNPTKRMFSAR